MKEWDVFISHASEDKESVVLPLAQLLRSAGLKVWIDQQQIKLGDSLRTKIDQGLAGSRFGIVILSPSFLDKDWPTRELNGLSAMEEGGHKVILPVWHDITRNELVQRSPMLADRLGVTTRDGLQNVARQIIDVVFAPGSGSPSAAAPSLPRLVANLVDSNADPKTIFSFLMMHETLVQRISGMTPHPKVTNLPPSLPWPCGFLCCLKRTAHSSTVVFLGPVNGPLFDSLRRPLQALESCTEAIRILREQIDSRELCASDGQRIYPPLDARILAGRRSLLTDDDLQGIDELKKAGVVIRTYDVLLELASTIG